VRGIVSPATPKIFKDALKEGIIDIFMDAGFCVTNPTCGACLGMSNGVLAEGEVCASTSNRNFNGRMGKGGMVHLMSPATAAATAIAGVIADARKL
jgi:3-isopropylmalate/(R)-2-methylmalate dehydratase large subunit